ncbi:TauD/TfdA dioxygenase family protein [Hydrogenophaga sp. BPS33]|uniref:TauD/TfdA dioxygenase family protein n=1 Tax=Hydrogenophaga sp. BPS33 TaxID=2651974 RepID=UPI00132038E1|nr:TauD/TfdA family dioxygenase [Hydrogenophaga sp. BPS33]QHE86022.1 taurine dioxygenase [Hydrogenophaga sp. BPS33]
MIQSTAFDVRPLTPTIGAEILNVDLARLKDAQFASIRRALLDHQVVFFRDQHLSCEQHIAFAQRFGSLQVHPMSQFNHPVHPELLRVYADENSKAVAGEIWHTDLSAQQAPPMASMLYLNEVPPVGGDTLFASMTTAFDALSPPMQQFLEGLTAVHDAARIWSKVNGVRPDMAYPRNAHPVVAVHPETGRKLLFVNKVFTSHVDGLSELESETLLAMLYRHIENPRFMCRFRWQPHSVAIWDNRCTQHQSIFDYFPARRSGLRATVHGTPPLASAHPMAQALLDAELQEA